MTFIAILGNWLERLIQPRNPDSADAWRERLIYIFLNLLILTVVLAFLADAFTSSLDAVRGLGGIAITVVVRLLAMRTPRVAGWFLVVAMPGTVYLSSEAWNHIKDRASSEYIPGLNVRGKGQMDMCRLREV